MFDIPSDVLDTWQAGSRPKASDADLERIDLIAGSPMPDDYKDFVATHGFVEFGNDPTMIDVFRYAVEQRDGVVEREDSIAVLYSAALVEDVTTRLRNAEPGDSLPILPPGLIVIGANADGESNLVLEPETGRVYFIPEVEEEDASDMVIGLVAESFTDFINGLKPSE